MMSSKKQSEARMSSSIRVFFSLAIAMHGATASQTVGPTHFPALAERGKYSAE